MRTHQAKVIDRISKERNDLKLEGNIDFYTIQKVMEKIDVYYSIE